MTLLKEEDVTIKINVTTEIKEDIVKHEIVSQECLLIGVRRLYIHVHCVYCDTILALKDINCELLRCGTGYGIGMLSRSHLHVSKSWDFLLGMNN